MVKPDKYLKHLLLLTVALKVSFLGLMLLSYSMFPFIGETYLINYHYPPGEEITLKSVLKTWDAHHYLRIAQDWYSPDAINSNAFFPLLPLLIKIFKFIFFQDPMVTGLFLSHILSLFSIYFFYQLVKLIKNEDIAFWSCLFMLSFPTAFFSGLIYTESLFLFLAITFLYLLYQGKYFGWSLFIVFLLPLSRPQGLFMLFPLAVFLFRKDGYSLNKKFLLIAGFIFGFAAYLGIMKYSTGTFFPQAQAQTFFVSNYSLSNIFHLKEWFIKNFIDTELYMHGLTNSWLDRMFFVFFLVMLLFNLRHCDLPLIVYSLSMGLLPALGDHFMSYSRYVMLVFPMYISLAILFRERNYLLTIPMFVLQVMFLMMHALNHWVA